MTMFSRLLCSLLFISSLPLTAYADVSLPRLLSEGMVLQRDTHNKLWGWADSGETVSAKLNGKDIGTTTAVNGRWMIEFKGLPAGGPHTIVIDGRNQIVLNDILFGDVWVASGQSNMQLPLYRVEERFPDEMANANLPHLRQFTVPREMQFNTLAEDFSGGQWEQTKPNLIRHHSATAYFFGKKIHQEEQVPVGILSANFGGSPAECWMSEEALKPYPAQYAKAKSYQDNDYLQSLKDADQADITAWFNHLNTSDAGFQDGQQWFLDNTNDSDWQTLSIPAIFEEHGIEPISGIMWFRKTLDLPNSAAGKAAFLRLGTLIDADTTYINGQQVGQTGYQYPPRRYPIKAGLLKAGKNTITIRLQIDNKGGAFTREMPYYLEIDQQKIDLTGEWRYKVGTTVDAPTSRRFVPWNEPLGCYNAMLPPLFNMPIKGVIWYQGESNTDRAQEYDQVFPDLIALWRAQWQQGDFPFIFVQLTNYRPAEEQPSESNWAELRFAQLKSLRVPNTAMAITIDVGDWNDLHPMDKQSVGERLALGAQALAYGKNIVYSGPILQAAHRNKNTVSISFEHVGKGLMAKGRKLGGFAIAGDDGQFVWAKAKIKDNKVIVWHPSIDKPTKVRYAWAHTPDTANLYNKNGLPASPFEITL